MKSEMTWKIWKKAKLNSEKIWKIWKKTKLNSEKIWKIQKNPKLNCEMIWKIWKKVKLKCEIIWKIWKKASRIVKRFGKYRRKLWKDMKNMENMEEHFFFLFYKTINTACNLFNFTLCPTVRRNNSVSEGINL